MEIAKPKGLEYYRGSVIPKEDLMWQFLLAFLWYNYKSTYFSITRLDEFLYCFPGNQSPLYADSIPDSIRPKKLVT